MSVRSDHSYHSFPPRVPRQPRMQESLASEWNRVKLGTSKAEFWPCLKTPGLCFCFRCTLWHPNNSIPCCETCWRILWVYRLPSTWAFHSKEVCLETWEKLTEIEEINHDMSSTLSFAVNFPRAVCLPFSADLVLPGWCSSSSYAPTDSTVTTWEQNGTKRIKETCLKYFKVRIQFTAYLTGSDECGWYDVFE